MKDRRTEKKRKNVPPKLGKLLSFLNFHVDIFKLRTFFYKERTYSNFCYPNHHFPPVQWLTKFGGFENWMQIWMGKIACSDQLGAPGYVGWNTWPSYFSGVNFIFARNKDPWNLNWTDNYVWMSYKVWKVAPVFLFSRLLVLPPQCHPRK